MEKDLTDWERKVLAAIPAGITLTTKGVAFRVEPVFGHNNRTHSGAIRSWLVGLEKRGLVERVGSEKPTHWRKLSAFAGAHPR